MSRSPSHTTTADVTYAAACAGAVGAAAVAGFFLIVDGLAGRPLHTPMAMGSAIFAGALPDAPGSLRLDFVAFYSLFHFVMFSAVGGLFALAAARVAHLPTGPSVLGAGLFTTLMSGMLVLDALVAPNLIGAIGAVPLVIGNLVASLAMTLFYVSVLTPAGRRIPVPTTLIGDA